MDKRWMTSWLPLALALALGMALAWPAAAQSGGGMNSNKPRTPDKLSSKEPAYKSMNSNKPAAKPGLSGVNPNDLKMKPTEKSSGKEAAK